MIYVTPTPFSFFGDVFPENCIIERKKVTRYEVEQTVQKGGVRVGVDFKDVEQLKPGDIIYIVDTHLSPIPAEVANDAAATYLTDPTKHYDYYKFVVYDEYEFFNAYMEGYEEGVSKQPAEVEYACFYNEGYD